MAERLAAGMEMTATKPAMPVFMQEAPLSAAVATALRPDIALWHRQNLRELYAFQKDPEHEEACFFISLYALSAALHPERQLPSADEFLAEIRPRYGAVLEPDKLLVPNHQLANALNIYDEWGMRITGLTRNKKAKELLGECLAGYQEQGLVRDIGSFAPVDVSKFRQPFAVWMHEGATNQAHFVTVDGSPEAEEMFQDYLQNKKYFPKMVIEVALKEEGVGKGS